MKRCSAKAPHEGEGQDVNSPNYLWHEWNGAGKTDDALQLFKKAATKNGITLYQSSEDDGDWGYYCYYFYWNRHDNNDNAGVMGDMEFAVVRNNVYKLAVTKINRLGHPRLSENDPDPGRSQRSRRDRRCLYLGIRRGVAVGGSCERDRILKMRTEKIEIRFYGSSVRRLAPR